MKTIGLKRIVLLLAALVVALLLLVGCGKEEYHYDFAVEPSATEIKYGDTVTFTVVGKEELSLTYWKPVCSLGLEVKDVTENSFTVTPLQEGRLYMRFTTVDSDGKKGPVSQTVAINVRREQRAVGTRDELLAATDPNVRYVLKNDIDMIGYETHQSLEFGGAFDGRGFTIKNFNYTPMELVKDKAVGFWSVNNGIIENVVFEAANVGIYSEAGSAGIVVGTNEGIVRNVTVKGKLTAEQTNYVGGICGVNNGTVESCTSEATVSGKQSTGGIVGSSVSAINGSTNTGSVTGTVEVGGIVGKIMEACSVYGNQNRGEVNGTSRVGGVIGFAAEGKIVQINSCHNYGKVNAVKEVGGVLGVGDSAVVFACRNEGVIVARSNYVGGIGGKVYSVRRCENKGTVSAEGKDIGGSLDIYLGGVAGYTREASECSNEQPITLDASGGNYVGGVAGYLDGVNVENKLNNNRNSGKIIASDTAKYVGGVFGYVKNAALRNTVNEGDVSGGTYTAGVVGYIESGGVYFTVNKGTVGATSGEEVAFFKDGVTEFQSDTTGAVIDREEQK